MWQIAQVAAKKPASAADFDAFWTQARRNQDKFALFLVHPRSFTLTDIASLKGVTIQDEEALKYLVLNKMRVDIQPVLAALHKYREGIEAIEAQQVKYDLGNMQDGNCMLDLVEKIAVMCPYVKGVDVVGEVKFEVEDAKKFFRKRGKRFMWFDCAYVSTEDEKREWKELLTSDLLAGMEYGPTLRTLFDADDEFIQDMNDTLWLYYSL